MIKLQDKVNFRQNSPKILHCTVKNTQNYLVIPTRNDPGYLNQSDGSSLKFIRPFRSRKLFSGSSVRNALWIEDGDLDVRMPQFHNRMGPGNFT